MFKKMLRRIHKSQRGITGLETAIILVAFVTVASVFAYTVLSAGIFSSEKGSEAVYSGLEGTRGTMEPIGSVIATGPTVIDDCDDSPVAWEAASSLPTGITSVTPAVETADKKEDTASVKLTIVTGGTPGTGLLAFHDLSSTVDLSKQTKAVLWIKSSSALTAANQLQLLLDETAECASPDETINIGTLSADTWTKVTLTFAAAASTRDAVASVGLNTGAALPASTTITVRMDHITGNEAVREVILTVANAIEGEPINLTVTTDSDSDGLLSDEGTKNHVVVVSYVDENQRINDIAWTKTWLGSNDSDDLLELNEKAQITVDLTSVLQGSNPLGINTEFIVEMNPDSGSSLVVERIVPANLDQIMDLH